MFQQWTDGCTPGNCRGNGVNEGEGACREEETVRSRRAKGKGWRAEGEQCVGREGRRGEGDDGDTCRFVSSWRVKCTHSPLFCPHIFSLSLCIGSHPPSVPLPHPLTPFIPTYYWSLKKKIGQPLCKEERRSGEGGRLWAEWEKKVKQSILDRKQSPWEWVGGIMKLACELFVQVERRVQIHKNNREREKQLKPQHNK